MEKPQIPEHILRKASMMHRIASRLRPEVSTECYLFGSQARGEARPDSDIDVLLVAKNLEDEQELSKFNDNLGMGLQLTSTMRDVQPLIVSKKEFDNPGCVRMNLLLVMPNVKRDVVCVPSLPEENDSTLEMSETHRVLAYRRVASQISH